MERQIRGLVERRNRGAEIDEMPKESDQRKERHNGGRIRNRNPKRGSGIYRWSQYFNTDRSCAGPEMEGKS